MKSSSFNLPHPENGQNMIDPSVKPEVESSETAPNVQENKGASPEQKTRTIKIKLDSDAHAKLLKNVEEMFAKNLPMDEITRQAGISENQAQKILVALMEERRITEYKPPYCIFPVKVAVKRLFSKLGIDFEEIKAVYNENGSITITPIHTA